MAKIEKLVLNALLRHDLKMSFSQIMGMNPCLKYKLVCPTLISFEFSPGERAKYRSL